MSLLLFKVGKFTEYGARKNNNGREKCENIRTSDYPSLGGTYYPFSRYASGKRGKKLPKVFLIPVILGNTI